MAYCGRYIFEVINIKGQRSKVLSRHHFHIPEYDARGEFASLTSRTWTNNQINKDIFLLHVNTFGKTLCYEETELDPASWFTPG